MDDRQPSDPQGPLRRVLRDFSGQDAWSALTRDLAGADLTTLLLEVMRQRAQRVSPSDLMRRYETDRFVAPASISYGRLRRAEEILLRHLPAEYELLALSPLLPLGSHSALATVDQNKIISTTRASEVAADPTNGLALEAASHRRRLRRNDPRSQEPVRLAAFQRVVRGQRFEGARQFSHFELLGLVAAGRDEGHLRFERASTREHITFAVNALLAVGASVVGVDLTDLTDGGMQPLCDEVREALSEVSDVEVKDWPDRPDGRGYYKGFCFRAVEVFGAEELEVADGGLVDWTAQLLQDRKERLLISGLGVERLALMLPSTQQ